jgi:hypothetical protein
MSSLREQAKKDALQLSEAIFFEPGCFYSNDSFHEERVRAIIKERAKKIGHPLSISELSTLVKDLADGKVLEAGMSGSEYSARLAIRITQRACS